MGFAYQADPDLLADFRAVTSLQEKSNIEGWNKLVSRINRIVEIVSLGQPEPSRARVTPGIRISPTKKFN